MARLGRRRVLTQTSNASSREAVFGARVSNAVARQARQRRRDNASESERPPDPGRGTSGSIRRQILARQGRAPDRFV